MARFGLTSFDEFYATRLGLFTRLRDHGQLGIPVRSRPIPHGASGHRFDLAMSSAEVAATTNMDDDETVREAKRVERWRVIANNAAWRSAETVRREWVAGFVTRKTPPSGAEALVYAALVSGAKVISLLSIPEIFRTVGGRKMAATFLAGGNAKQHMQRVAPSQRNVPQHRQRRWLVGSTSSSTTTSDPRRSPKPPDSRVDLGVSRFSAKLDRTGFRRDSAGDPLQMPPYADHGVSSTTFWVARLPRYRAWPSGARHSGRRPPRRAVLRARWQRGHPR
jgi:hypothetical protein